MINKNQLKSILAEHAKWIQDDALGTRADLSRADLRHADLSSANLRDANLRHADLSRADLDFSCWPLWCGSTTVRLDTKQKRQLLYHVLAVATEYRTPELLAEANQFHRIPEVPKLDMQKKDVK